MDDVLDAVHDGVRLCNLAVDSCHPRLKRIYMRGCTRTRAHAFSATLSNKSKTHGGNTHTILDRAVPKLGGDDLEYFPLQPATFGHCCIGIPIRRDLAQAGTRGCRRRGGCGHGIRRHGGEEHATKYVSELVRGGHKDEWEMDFVRVEGKDG